MTNKETTRKATAVFMMIALVGAGALLLPASMAQEETIGEPACTEADNDFGEEGSLEDPRCPPSVEGGASCISHGLLVATRGLTTGDLTASTSEASALPSEESQMTKKYPNLEPPKSPDARSTANQVGVSYTVGPLDVRSDTVHSRCDVVSVAPDIGNAYGAAGAEDLKITLGGAPILSAGALNYELDAVAYETADAHHDCTFVNVALAGAGPWVCPPPNTGILGVTLNEAWGPVLVGGQWVYGGAAAHYVLSVAGETVDVYVGYVAVGVSGWGAFPPSFHQDPIR